MTITRRRFLASSLALAACDSAQPRSPFLGAMDRWNSRFQRWLQADSREAPRPSDAALTPERAFPVYHASPFPPPTPAGWMLLVSGKVARPQMISLADLQRLPRVDLRVEHHCVEGWSAVADWHGVRVADVAELAGADPRAEFVEFRSFDAGYWSSWDRESALHRHTLLAYGMNGHDLGPAHGAPLRVYSPLKLGYKNVKYLTALNFLDRNSGGYWENTGYEWFAGV
jgi:DMSO/TMAO reductase YedYZ molybdopterin-dependent catalytic subunit